MAKAPYWISLDVSTIAGRVNKIELNLSLVEWLQITRDGVWPDGTRYAGEDKIISVLFRYADEVKGISTDQSGQNPEAGNEFYSNWETYRNEQAFGLQYEGARMEPQSTLIQAAGLEFNVSPIVKA